MYYQRVAAIVGLLAAPALIAVGVLIAMDPPPTANGADGWPNPPTTAAPPSTSPPTSRPGTAASPTVPPSPRVTQPRPRPPAPAADALIQTSMEAERSAGVAINSVSVEPDGSGMVAGVAFPDGRPHADLDAVGDRLSRWARVPVVAALEGPVHMFDPGAPGTDRSTPRRRPDVGAGHAPGPVAASAARAPIVEGMWVCAAGPATGVHCDIRVESIDTRYDVTVPATGRWVTLRSAARGFRWPLPYRTNLEVAAGTGDEAAPCSCCRGSKAGRPTRWGRSAAA